MTEVDGACQRIPSRTNSTTGLAPKIFDAFEELESGDALTLINDHEPTPLYHQMAAEIDPFDAEGYTVDRVGPNEFIATLPKK